MKHTITVLKSLGFSIDRELYNVTRMSNGNVCAIVAIFNGVVSVNHITL